jgi:hypothetical protein
VKLQTLHEAQTPAAPVIRLTKATRTKRVSSSTVRVGRAPRKRRARAKSLPAGEKTMVGWDGIEPPTPGFPVEPGGPDHAPPSSGIVDNQADGEG